MEGWGMNKFKCFGGFYVGVGLLDEINVQKSL
jgi:hypothetical protein